MDNLLRYTGDKNLGLGSNADVPAIPDKNLDVLNNTLDRLQVQNAARNQQLFQQKIRDRDALIGAIDSGKIKVGDLLEQDMPTVTEGLQKLDDAYFDRIKKGVNDLEAARAYKKALRDAQDRVTQAEARKVHYDTLNGEIAKEKLPRKQEAMKKHLDQTINSGFFKDLTPFQQAQDLDIAGSILSTAATATEQFTDPKNPLMKGKRTLFDYDKTYLANKDNFLNDVNKQHDQEQLIKAVQSQSPREFKETIDAINARIGEYNTLKNLSKGQPGYVTEVDFAIDPASGRPMINEPLPDFAAKYTLAHQTPFSSVETKFDKDQATYLQDQKELASIDAYRKGQLANDRNRLGFDWAKFNYGTEEDKFGASTVINEAKDIIGKGVETKVEGPGGGVVLRIGDPTLLKQFGNIDKEGNVTNVPDAIDYDRKKDQVKLVYYDESPTETGKNKIVKTVSLDQRTWLKEIAKRSFPNKDIGKVNTLVDDILTQNGNSLYKLTQNKPLEYPLPKGQPKTVQQNGYTYTWDEKTGEYK